MGARSPGAALLAGHRPAEARARAGFPKAAAAGRWWAKAAAVAGSPARAGPWWAKAAAVAGSPARAGPWWAEAAVAAGSPARAGPWWAKAAAAAGSRARAGRWSDEAAPGDRQPAVSEAEAVPRVAAQPGATQPVAAPPAARAAREPTGPFPSQACLSRADSLVAQMTANEKYGQMLQMERVGLTNQNVTEYRARLGLQPGRLGPVGQLRDRLGRHDRRLPPGGAGEPAQDTFPLRRRRSARREHRERRRGLPAQHRPRRHPRTSPWSSRPRASPPTKGAGAAWTSSSRPWSRSRSTSAGDAPTRPSAKPRSSPAPWAWP